MLKKRDRAVTSNANSTYFLATQGQVTVFIILGMVLLIAVALVILFKTEVISFKTSELLPTNKGKVENLITLCMEQVGEEGLLRMGVQGGYVEVPLELATDGSLHLRISPMNVVPYWAYGVETNIPSLENLAQRLDEHMEQQLRTCVLGMDAFQETYDIVEKSSLDANTEIVDSKVIFNVHWNIEIRSKSGEVIAEVLDHYAESPVKLKRLHETAQTIVQQELETLKLEDLTQDLIALEHPQVPVAGVDFSCTRREWDVYTVKNTLQELLRFNIRQLKVQGTNFVEFPEELTYYQNHYEWFLGEEFKQPEVQVAFTYEPTYPFIFDITPLQGTKLRSSQLGGTGLLSVVCLQTWKFTYDVTYPVLIQITDETTGYTLNTAVTVHVVRNFPNRAAVSTSRPSYFSSNAVDEEYCRTKNIPLTVFTYEKVENEETGVYVREPLEDVNTSFTCLRYRCTMGQTVYDFSHRGDVAGYTQYFPYCPGGILRAEKQNYKEDWQRVVTKAGTEVELNLVPLFSVPASNITILQHDIINGRVGAGRPLGREQVASLRLIYIKPNQTEPFHDSSIAFSERLGEKIINEQQLQFLAQTDYRYAVDINLIEDENLVGGYKAPWVVPWEELEKAQEVVFHVLHKPVGSEQELFEFLLTLPNQSMLLPLPEIK